MVLRKLQGFHSGTTMFDRSLIYFVWQGLHFSVYFLVCHSKYMSGRLDPLVGKGFKSQIALIVSFNCDFVFNAQSRHLHNQLGMS